MLWTVTPTAKATRNCRLVSDHSGLCMFSMEKLFGIKKWLVRWSGNRNWVWVLSTMLPFFIQNFYDFKFSRLLSPKMFFKAPNTMTSCRTSLNDFKKSNYSHTFNSKPPWIIRRELNNRLNLYKIVAGSPTSSARYNRSSNPNRMRTKSFCFYLRNNHNNAPVCSQLKLLRFAKQ